MLQDQLALAASDRRALLEVAKGKRPADLWLRGGHVLNVFTGRAERADVAIVHGRIATLDAPRAGARTTRDVTGLFLAPGLIEPHSHSALLHTPTACAPLLLRHGTTTLFEDSHPFLTDVGLNRFPDFFASLPAPPRRFWLTRLRPATLGPYPTVAALHPVLLGARSAGAMEITAWGELLDAPVDLFEAFSKPLPGTVDGHFAGASPGRLAALALTGARACHEATTAEEAAARLRLGLWTILRHSPLRPDLKALVQAVTRLGLPADRLMFTTDGPTAVTLTTFGHLDGAVRTAIACGVPPFTALRMATLNVATYLGVDAHLGAVAPGRLADIVLLKDPLAFTIEDVLFQGESAADLRPARFPPYPASWLPATAQLDAALAAEVPATIDLESAAITRWRRGDGPVVRLMLLHEQGTTVAEGTGFGAPGGIATTLSLTKGALVLGTSEADMRLAFGRLRAIGGGIVLVHGGIVQAELPLPLGGQMNDGPIAETATAAAAFAAAWRSLGYAHGEPFFTLYFLTGDFLPDARLTVSGLYDVKRRKALGGS